MAVHFIRRGRMHWLQRIMGGTRAELLALLRRSRRSISELAGALGITDNAVRMHVAALERDGMVRGAGVERGTGGKPARLYELTPAAEEMYPKGYAAVLNGLLDLLVERHGQSEAIGMLREVGARAATAERPRGGSEAERVESAAEALRQLGGDVEVERGDAVWRIRGYGCPLSAVVSEHEEACALAETLVAEITGLPARECCERGERPRCAVEVESREG